MGQASDFTALCVVERSKPGPPDRTPDKLIASGAVTAPPGYAPAPARERRYAVRHLERFPRGTPYPVIVERVVRLFAAPPLAGSVLAVDQTGVGRPVVDMLRRARPRATIRPVTITAGHAAVADGAGWHVPKRELVGALQVLLQSRRLRVAKALPGAALLVQELEAFRVKLTPAASETFEAWREKDHDDLVLAVAIIVDPENWVVSQGHCTRPRKTREIPAKRRGRRKFSAPAQTERRLELTLACNGLETPPKTGPPANSTALRCLDRRARMS